jgi:hypothetical protein
MEERGGSLGSLTGEEPECTVWPLPHLFEGVLLRARGKGLREEGGERRDHLVKERAE